jgi:C4-dicarboxylate-specific signal transduction histidine kinase
VARVVALGEMTASIAHEVNQPLAAVVNNATACVNFLDARRFDDARECAEQAIADGHRAADVIDGIRALVKNDAPRRDPVDVNAIILDVIGLVRSEVHGHGISVRTRLDDALAPVVGDRTQLQQVVLNLLMNGIEALSGSEAAPRELSIVSMPANGRAVQVSVADSGPGVSPAMRERLFQAFHTTKPHGMGMGLAISRSIVEAHGGRLWATANEPRGAVFVLTLPTEQA